MKKQIDEKLKVSRTLSIITIVLGVLLMAYMIKVESEPGALPLFLVVAGVVWLAINQHKIKKAVVGKY